MVFDWSSSSTHTSASSATPAGHSIVATQSTADSTAKKPKLEDESTTPSAAIGWAAFYSDCVHEVRPVHSGNRITLTYNLYTTPLPAGRIAGSDASPLAASQLPISKKLKNALARKDFYPDGRVLAIKLGHAYAHTSQRLRLLPEALKGGDMYLYECWKGLGLECEFSKAVSLRLYPSRQDSHADISTRSRPSRH